MTGGCNASELRCESPCAAGVSLFGNHVIEVWSWQVYMYAIATALGVTFNAVLLMHMLT